MKQARGFTLVEMAIVLVVVGLIIGGVLGGQQIMTSARTKTFINDMQAFQAAFQTYSQNYRAVAGDDSNAVGRFGTNVSANGDGDGRVGITSALTETYNRTGTIASNEESESQLVWEMLRAATLVKGSGAAQPTNPFNGIYGVQNGAFSDGIPLGTNVVCGNQVPGAAALAIDTQMDDGEPESGAVRGGTGALDDAAATTYDTGSTYTLCTAL